MGKLSIPNSRKRVDQPQRYTELQVKALEYLFSEKLKSGRSSYLSLVARELGISKPSVAEGLAELEKRGFLRSYMNRGTRVYQLTEKGEAIAWAMSRTDELEDVYKNTVMSFSDTQRLGIHDFSITLLREHLRDFVNIYLLLQHDLLKEKNGISQVYIMDYSEVCSLSLIHI